MLLQIEVQDVPLENQQKMLIEEIEELYSLVEQSIMKLLLIDGLC